MIRSMHSLVVLSHYATFVIGQAHHHDLYHQPYNPTLEVTAAPDVFDSCIVVCYDDILRRFGSDFADELKAGGFKFANCQDEQDHDTATSSFRGRSDEDKQQALNRILGATSQLNKLWNTRGLDGKLNIPYAISSTSAFTQETITTIESALSYVQDSTGIITFIPRTTENEYIHFTYEPYFETICASNIGRQTNTSTNIYLGYCRFFQHKMIIVHQLVHALGFWHEHSRPDRDNYITIQWDNVQADSTKNFAKSVEVNSAGSPYDYASVMHFPDWAYAKNPNLPTIVNTTLMEKGVVMGQREKLSDADIYQLRLLYQCESGPRSGSISVKDLCSEDCKCWEYAPGECVSDNECLGDLICAEAPVSPAENLVLPSMICRTAPVGSIAPTFGPSKKPSDVLSHTAAPANNTTSKLAYTPRQLYVVWYIDWHLGRCVQDCVGGWTCGGYKPVWVKEYYSLEMCCSMMSWKSFEDCAPIPPRPTKEPTPQPSSQPSLRPSKQPTSKPSQNPTSNPTSRTTSAPSSLPTKKPTNSPSQIPTNFPTSRGPTNLPTRPPTLSPTKLERPFTVFTQDAFNAVAPNAVPPFTYSGLVKAVSLYNSKNPGAGIFTQGSEMKQRQELAAFLANAMHGSDDFQTARNYLACGDSFEADGEVFCKPCNSADFNSTLKTCKKSLVSNDVSYGAFCNPALSPASNPDGCSCSAQFEDSVHPGYVNANKLFFGRGSGIMSWNYNYIDASVAITGSKETFCANPDLVATDEVYVWSAGLWLWMEVTDGVLKTSHQSIFDDGDFGGTVNNANGASECPAVRSASIGAVKARLNRYCRMATVLQVDTLLNLDGCTGLSERLSQCLVDGSCPHCNRWSLA